MAYGEVKLDRGFRRCKSLSGEYEDPDKLARSGQGEGDGGNSYEPIGFPAPYELPASQPEAPVYATAANSGKTSI
jgi:hypothetical protein